MARLIRVLKYLAKSLYHIVAQRWVCRWTITCVNLLRNRRKKNRQLEIGPGDKRLDGFETLNIMAEWNVDYIIDATRKLPFKENTFQLIYASHILEHVAWYQTERTLREWVRVLEPRGTLEVWVPNGLEICRVFVDYETTGEDRTHLDGWYRFNPEKDPCKWASGRIFTYGDGTGKSAHPNWHRAVFSPRYLEKLFETVGLTEVRQMELSEVRGHNHGWINLGFQGTKP